MVLEAPFFWQALTFGWMLKANLGTEVATEYHQFAQRKKRQGDVEGEGSGEGERKKEEKKRKKNKLTWTFCLLARASRVHASSPACILCFRGCLLDPLFGERPVVGRLPLFKTKTQPKTPHFPSLPPSLCSSTPTQTAPEGLFEHPLSLVLPCCRMFEDGLLLPSHPLVSFWFCVSLSHFGCLWVGKQCGCGVVGGLYFVGHGLPCWERRGEVGSGKKKKRKKRKRKRKKKKELAGIEPATSPQKKVSLFPLLPHHTTTFSTENENW